MKARSLLFLSALLVVSTACKRDDGVRRLVRPVEASDVSVVQSTGGDVADQRSRMSLSHDDEVDNASAPACRPRGLGCSRPYHRCCPGMNCTWFPSLFGFYCE
jgi:hypothetical protein